MEKLLILALAAALFVGETAFGANRFDFLFSWGYVKDEASARAFSEIGVTDVLARGRDGFAAARRFGLKPYCLYTPVGPHKQILREDEQKHFDFINASDCRERLSKEDLRKLQDERRAAAAARFGGEPVAAMDTCATLIDCFLSDTNCVMAKAKIDKMLAENPDADGIAFDYIGYTNLRSCECCDCKSRLVAFLKSEGLENGEYARNLFYRTSLVSYINALVNHVPSARPGTKVTIHLYPVFLPDPIYGKDLRADTIQETVAWYFQWPDEKIADYTRQIGIGARQSSSASVPFVGVNATPGKALAFKSPERLEAELRILLEAGGRRLGVCNGGDMIKPGYREVFIKYCRK